MYRGMKRKLIHSKMLSISICHLVINVCMWSNSFINCVNDWKDKLAELREANRIRLAGRLFAEYHFCI